MGQTDFYATVLGPPSVGQNPPGGGKMGTGRSEALGSRTVAVLCEACRVYRWVCALRKERSPALAPGP